VPAPRWATALGDLQQSDVLVVGDLCHLAKVLRMGHSMRWSARHVTQDPRARQKSDSTNSVHCEIVSGSHRGHRLKGQVGGQRASTRQHLRGSRAGHPDCESRPRLGRLLAGVLGERRHCCDEGPQEGKGRGDGGDPLSLAQGGRLRDGDSWRFAFEGFRDRRKCST